MKLPTFDLKERKHGSLTKLFHTLFIAAIASLITIYLIAPNAPNSQLIMATEIALSIGLTIGYTAGAQLPEPEEKNQT
jgi:hypothetical protein